MIEAIAQSGFWIWLIGGAALMALETIVPGVHFLWFGLAALVVGIITSILSALGMADALSFTWQMVVFALLSGVTVVYARQFTDASQTKSDEPGLNDRGALYRGRLVVLDEPIRAGRGRVRVGDTVWVCEGPDTDAGQQVRVSGARGSVLIVEPA